MLQNIVFIVQIVSATLLIAAILLQAKGTGLGSAWGGGGEFYRSKRGAEKVLFNATVVLASIFLLLSIVSVVLV